MKYEELSDNELDEIDIDKLYMESFREQCPECNAAVGHPHEPGCDIARCPECGLQAISCGHISSVVDTWTGYYPGYKTCREKKYLCRNTDSDEVMFDLNRLHQVLMGRRV